jgi:uncharacterized membrane protein
MRRYCLALVIALGCLTLLIGWWSKARCLTDGGWTGGEQYFSWCYTDIVPLYAHRGLVKGDVPYLDNPVEYPVLTGAQMWLAAQIGRNATSFYHVTALAGAGFWLAMIVMLARAGTPPGRLVFVAGAPSVVAYAFINWDPLPALLLVLAILAHLRGRDVASGVWAGLGVATKLFPGVVIPLVAAARLAQRRWRDALAHVAAASGAWLAVNLPVMILAPQGWRRFLDLNRERGADWDSLWFLLQHFTHANLNVSTINLSSGFVFLAGAVVIGVVGAQRRDPADWWQLTLPILCWFLLSNKVYSPQYSLLLLPLLALALPSPGAFWAFAVADIMVFAIRFPFLAGQEGFSPAPGLGVFAFALLTRAVILAWITVATTLHRDETFSSAAQAPVIARRSLSA